MSQAEAGDLLPLVGEAAHIGEFGDLIAVANEHPERPAGLDGAQLRPVADEHDLGSDLGGVFGDAIECERSCGGEPVHEHELPGFEVPASVVVFVEELRGVLRPDTDRVAKHFGSGC